MLGDPFYGWCQFPVLAGMASLATSLAAAGLHRRLPLAPQA